MAYGEWQSLSMHAPSPQSMRTHRSKREWKISNLKTENDKIKGKEAQEGGLTPGQASTLVRLVAAAAAPSLHAHMRTQPACILAVTAYNHHCIIRLQVRNDRAIDALTAELEDLEEEMSDSVAAAIKGRAEKAQVSAVYEERALGLSARTRYAVAGQATLPLTNKTTR